MAATQQNPLGSTIGAQANAQANAPYPVIVQTSPAGGGVGLPPIATAVPASAPSNVNMENVGALTINPALAGDYYAGKYIDQTPFNNRNNAPLETENKVVSQTQATKQSPGAWKDAAAPAFSNAILFGGNPPQKALLPQVTQNLKFIPPLSLYNDASQWVNNLFFAPVLTAWGFASSIFRLRPAGLAFQAMPNNTNNLSAGALNLQLQLGQMRIQAAQLTTEASNYFGGS